MANTNTGKQGGAPAVPNNFSAKKPNDDKAPKIGGTGFSPTGPNSNKRGQQGQ